MSTTETTTYRCGACGYTLTVPATDDLPVCDRTDRCGLLFDDEIVPVRRRPLQRAATALAGRRLTFRPCDTGYVIGDERAYYVSRDGIEIGIVEREWGVNGGHNWGFSSHAKAGRPKLGSGRTRAEAVLDAYKTI